MNRRPGFPARLDQAVAPPRPSGAPAPSAARPNRAPERATAWAVPAGLGMDSHAVRQRMVQKLAAQGIQSTSVLAAMGQVERHAFVDSALVNQSYEDTSLPIGLGQTISKPSVVARMLDLLMQAPIVAQAGLGRVLEVGTGCGYQAAVLSLLAREVYSIERLRGLHEKARENLRPMRLSNLHLLLGDGMEGFAKGAPYAGIVAAAGGEAVPQAWCDQLAVGGRLVAPTVMSAGKQALVVIDKTAQGLQQTVLEAVHFVPLKSGIA
ncbi:MAG: protein-L-isoaspartate(D-aspartate) O-methyltransferase [Curvibacter sp.]|nr:MAG: protein-L-isoaspartate(D-aspartate) O-methyltransferase [Curvibacter sp.]